jgi:hypothetical protein
VGSPRTATFLIGEGVGVFGGFAGGETQRSQRDPVLRVAVLDGDMAQNGNNLIADNALHVVTILGASSATTIDGFTIVNGVASFLSEPNSHVGGGMLVAGGGPIVRACVFDECASDFLGGGLALLGSTALVEGCVFRENRAFGGNGVYHGENSAATIRACRFEGQPALTGSSVGAGILSGRPQSMSDASRIRVEDCMFAMTPAPGQDFGTGLGAYVAVGEADIRRCDFLNLRTSHGGAGVSGEGTVRIDRCRFVGCEGRFDGGAAVHTFQGAYTISNSLFVGNDREGFSTLQSGGPTEVINCTFYANGSTSSFHAVVLPQSASVALRNCIFWGNLSNTGTQDAVASLAHHAVPRFDDCIVQGWDGRLPGDRSFNADPLFVGPVGPDGVGGTLDDDLRLLPASPAIDRGNNAGQPPDASVDFAGAARRQDVVDVPDLGLGRAPVIDRGAFEASGVTCGTLDYNQDGNVDQADVTYLVNVVSGGDNSTGVDPDFNRDGNVDQGDVDALLNVVAGGACP